MALAVLTLSCFLLYATSKYFPFKELAWIKKKSEMVMVIATAISFASLYLFTYTYNFETAILVWMVAFMTILSAVILSIKMNKKWIWVWSTLSVLFILIDIL